jgi:hypothetical protein
MGRDRRRKGMRDLQSHVSRCRKRETERKDKERENGKEKEEKTKYKIEASRGEDKDKIQHTQRDVVNYRQRQKETERPQ